MLDEIVTVSATPNIALVKYWGKRRKGEDCDDPALNLPQNSSFSITLDAGDMLVTKTSVVFSRRIGEDTFYLNGKKQDLDNAELKERFIALGKLRALAGIDANVLIVSNNSFPTASGLASSASGLAALVLAAAKALDLKLEEKRLSAIARIGSGSSCRSLFGGFVEWKRGARPDGSDSVAEQIFNESHWPELAILITITSQDKKKISSRAGMKQTIATSELYKLRPQVAERNVKEIKEAIKKHDFRGMADVIMRDSMMMHATMMDTKPPIIYLSDISREIIYAIEELNATHGRAVAAYTFDAGPNACIITKNRDVKIVLEKLKGIEGIERILNAKVGAGPKVLAKADTLIDHKNFVPMAMRR